MFLLYIIFVWSKGAKLLKKQIYNKEENYSIMFLFILYYILYIIYRLI